LVSNLVKLSRLSEFDDPIMASLILGRLTRGFGSARSHFFTSAPPETEQILCRTMASRQGDDQAQVGRA
jgi:hypothetical protein